LSDTTILIVDDEEKVRTLLRRCYEKESYLVIEAACGSEMHEKLSTHDIDLITLDINLDSEDGLELAREVRASQSVPIIMVSGKGDLIDTVVGLEVGADDYITKPFELREVIARTRAVLRRYQGSSTSSTETADSSDTNTLTFDRWVLNTSTRELFDTDQNPVPLTSGEYDLLALFATHSRKVLSRDQIMDLLKGNEWMPNDRTIDNQVARHLFTANVSKVS